MKNFTPEMIEKAKAAKTAEELLALAKENNVEMTEESAKAYYEQIHKTGELADDELDNVAGGGCYHDGQLVVTVGTIACDHFRCEHCGSEKAAIGTMHTCLYGGRLMRADNCGNCISCKYIDGLWLCTNSYRNGTK